MITWQPIETAPKDGTRFLGYRPISEGEWEYEAFAIWWWYENPRVKRSWFTCTDEADAYEVENEPPSHWMPLPEPPGEIKR